MLLAADPESIKHHLKVADQASNYLELTAPNLISQTDSVTAGCSFRSAATPSLGELLKLIEQFDYNDNFLRSLATGLTAADGEPAWLEGANSAFEKISWIDTTITLGRRYGPVVAAGSQRFLSAQTATTAAAARASMVAKAPGSAKNAIGLARAAGQSSTAAAVSRGLGAAGVALGTYNTVNAIAEGDTEEAVTNGLSTLGSVLMMAGPTPIGVLGAFIAAGVIVYQNWDTIEAGAKKVESFLNPFD